MTSIIARAGQSCRSWPLKRTVSLTRGRSLHASIPVYKKKGKPVIESLFGPDDADSSTSTGDLFDTKTTDISESIKPMLNTTASTSRSQSQTTDKAASRPKLTPEARLARFNKLRQYVADRIGKKPVVRKEQIRDSAWVHLLGLATTPEQVQEVMSIFPRWTEGGREFKPRHAEALIRRCEELHCPLLAMEVFTNHQKYVMHLPSSSVSATRQLIHSLHQEHPLQHTITATALYDMYKLPPVSTDLVSCAMVMSACLRHARREQLAKQAEQRLKQKQKQKGNPVAKPMPVPPSLVVASSLLPSLKRLITTSPPLRVPKDKLKKERMKERVWLKWSLARIEVALMRMMNTPDFSHLVKTEGYMWLRAWRISSGHTEAEVPPILPAP